MEITSSKIGTTTADLPFYGLMILVFVVAKLIHPYSNAETLQWLLAPVSHSISLFLNSPILFSAENGYHLPLLHIMIDKSCSGYNFLLIAFLTISISMDTNRKKTLLQSLKTIVVAMIIAYVLTIIANTSRIISIIKMNNLLPTLATKEWFHAAQGTFVYLLFLIGFYLLFNNTLNNVFNNTSNNIIQNFDNTKQV